MRNDTVARTESLAQLTGDGLHGLDRRGVLCGLQQPCDSRCTPAALADLHPPQLSAWPLATACGEVGDRPDRLDDEGKHPDCLRPANLVTAAAREITQGRQRHHRLEGATHDDGTLLKRREVRPRLLRHALRLAARRRRR